MAIGPERPAGLGETWFAKQLGEGWTSAGGGIYYPPEPGRAVPEPVSPVRPEPVAAETTGAHRLPQRRRELLRLRDRLVERVARFPNPVAERQLRELEHELAALVRRLGPFNVAGQG
jgi:hypothetical protein